MKNKLRQPISLSITEQESELLYQLNAKGIKNISVFRRGLQAYEADLIGDITQNNNA